MISVIMPVFNAESYVDKAIQSILDQTYGNIGLDILNDGSMDGSQEIIDSFSDPRIRSLNNENNIGYLRSINRLLEQSTGDYIAFQDADDISHPRRLELQRDFLDRNPEVSIVGTNYQIVDESGKVLRSEEVREGHSELMSLLPQRNPFQKPSLMFRKEVFQKIGGYREAFLMLKNISEDYDWLLRASHYFHFGNINFTEPLYTYRSVGTAMTKDFNDIEQLFGHKVAQYLHKQRVEKGEDDLDLGNVDALLDYVEELKQPYLEDTSMFFREKAGYLVYGALYNEATKAAWQGLRHNLTYENLKLLLYCVRKRFGV